MRIKSGSEPVYGDNDKKIKTKIKLYGDSVNTNFQGEKMPKEKAPCNSLSTIMLDSVVKAKKKYYLQTFLEECKYKPKKIKMENLSDNDLEKSLSDSETDNDSNDETKSDDEKDNDESNE